jgi:membrane-bound lytic murein transglycosylase B
MDEQLTEEEIQRKYNAAMDSVNLLNAGKPTDETDNDWADTVRRNVEHLKIMVGKDFWQGQDLTPLHKAIKENDNG